MESMIDAGETWLTLADAAERTKFSGSYLRGKIAAGRLRACRPDRGRAVRIAASELAAFMDGPPARAVDPLPARTVVVRPRVGARQRARRHDARSAVETR
jgi:excisionase family DNA binding protein